MDHDRQRDAHQHLSHERTVDLLRQRLYNLSQSIQRMAAIISHPGPSPNAAPLPAWGDLSAFLTAITSQIVAVQDILTAQSKMLTVDHVFATPTYPLEKENMLNMLLAKRLAPDFDNWFERSLDAGTEVLGNSPRVANALAPSINVKGLDWQSLWNWAGPAENNIAAEILGEARDDEEDEGEDSNSHPRRHGPSQDNKVALELNSLLRLLNTGTLPPATTSN